jgi:hypothetical protein
MCNFHVDTSITAPTLIHVLQAPVHGTTWYPNGVDIRVFGDTFTAKTAFTPKVTWDGNTIQVLVDQHEFDGTLVQISIMPKAAGADAPQVIIE